MLEVIELPPLLLDDTERRMVVAGSGMVRVGEWLHVVADDALHLASFHVPLVAPGSCTAFREGALPIEHVARKAAKPDIESLLVLTTGGACVLVGLPSGSTAARQRGFAIALSDDGSVDLTAGSLRELALDELYDVLATAGHGQLNVEGAVQQDDGILLLLRSSTGANRIAWLDADGFAAGVDRGSIASTVLRSIEEVELGALHGVPLGFTDATLVDGVVWFSAAAEATSNAYDDGPISGSVVGRLDRHGMPVETWVIASDGAKVEGISPAESLQPVSQLWLLTDEDDAAQPSRLLRCELPGFASNIRSV